MKNKALELIDFNRINSLLEGFNNSTGFVTAILDLEGKVLSKSGWRHICTEYHRVNPGTSKKCFYSDTVLANKMAEGEKYHFYKCLNGLIDVAVPIVINGKHVANLFSGQFFLEPPNRQFFIQQARQYGFDEHEYLEALDQVPIVTEEKVKLTMDFLLDLTQLITELTMQSAKEKELVQKVKESEERYRLLVDNSPYAIGVHQDGKMVFANPAMVKLVGAKSKKELTDKSIVELMHPETREAALKRIENMLKGDTSLHQSEGQLLKLDGNIVPVVVTAAPLMHEGRPAIQIIFTDTTDRKEAEAQLREHHAILNALMESASTPVFSIDRKYRYTSFNSIHASLMQALYGADIEIGKSILSYLTNPEDRSDARKNLDRSLAGEQFIDSTYSGEASRSRRYFEIAFNPISDADGKVIGVSVFATDITKRKQAEETLAEKNYLLSESQRIAHIGSYIWDIITGKIIWSDECYRLFGVHPDTFSVTLESAIACIHPEDQHKAQEWIKAQMEGQESYPITYRTVWRDGSVHWLVTSGEVFPDENGKPGKMIGTIQDITERVRLDESLRKSEEKFRRVFESSNVGKSITRPDGKVSVNKAFADMLGYSLSEFKNITWQQLTPKEDIDAVQLYLAPLLNGDSNTTRFEKRYIHKNGSIIWTDVSTVLHRDDKSKPQFFITTIVDITNRKNIEDELRQANSKLEQSEKRLIKMFHMGPVAKVLTRLSDSIIMDFNTAAEKIFDYKARDVVGQKAMDVEFWSDADQLNKVSELFLKQGYLDNIEFQYKTPKGRTGWASIFAEIFTIDDEKYILNEFIDISDRKLAEQEQKKFYLLSESSNEFIGMCDLDMQPVYVNTAGIQKVGLPDLATACQVKVQDYFFPEDRAFIEKEFYPRVLKEGHGDVEIRLRHFVTGEPIWYYYYLFSVQDDAGKTIGWATVSHDITGRRKAEEEIRKLNSELEQRVIERTAQLEAANKELEAFSYSVSHDLRSPLRHINGYIELLKQDLQNDRKDEIQHYLASVSRASTQMGRLIDDLLQFSRTGRQELHQEFQDMNQMVSELIKKMEIEIQNRNISWHIMQFPAVYGDSSMLKQVWANLLDNAVKYTRDQKNTEITIGVHEEDKEFVFFVQDNGVGFDMKYAHKLFGVFQRLHSTGDFEGTGIGLANVQRIINKHNGRVWAEAEKNKGATFYFSIPKKKQDI